MRVNNTNFNRILEQSGKSMYALSKQSGVPYTTINEIGNGKKDINQCAAGTVHRIAAALDVSADAILNEIYYLEGVKGKYKGIDYIWSTDDSSQITFQYEGEDITLSTGRVYNIPNRIDYYQVIAGWMIKEYIARTKWKKQAFDKLERIRHDE